MWGRVLDAAAPALLPFLAPADATAVRAVDGQARAVLGAFTFEAAWALDARRAGALAAAFPRLKAAALHWRAHADAPSALPSAWRTDLRALTLMTPCPAAAVTTALSQLHALTSVVLADVAVDSAADAAAFAAAIVAHDRLAALVVGSLRLRGHALDAAEWARMTAARATFLRGLAGWRGAVLCLAANQLGMDACVHALANALPTLTNLRVLVLLDCGLGSPAAQAALCTALGALHGLTKLHLEPWALFHAGVAALVAALPALRALECLIVDVRPQAHQPSSPLLAALAGLTRLRLLGINGACLRAGQSAPVLGRIESLYVETCGLTVPDVAPALRACTTAAFLSLTGLYLRPPPSPAVSVSPQGPLDGDALAAALPPRLTRLLVQHAHGHLAPLFAGLPALSTLSLQGCRIDGAAADALASLLASGRVAVLEVGGAFVAPELVARLQAACPDTVLLRV